ncbi:YchJ family protein [Arenicella sp. 4NH20-0111]
MKRAIHTKICPCGTGKQFENCCERFLSKREIPDSPLLLMRSRYSAFALGGYGDYLVETWIPRLHAGLSSAELSVRDVNWVGLTIHSHRSSADLGEVEFSAYFTDLEHNVQEHRELSSFCRENGRWFYVEALR